MIEYNLPIQHYIQWYTTKLSTLPSVTKYFYVLPASMSTSAAFAAFTVPPHFEKSHCECLNMTQKNCARKSKFRFINEFGSVRYTCGASAHTYDIGIAMNGKFFIEEKKTNTSAWTIVRRPSNWLFPRHQIPPTTPPTTPPKTQKTAPKTPPSPQKPQQRDPSEIVDEKLVHIIDAQAGKIKQLEAKLADTVKDTRINELEAVLARKSKLIVEQYQTNKDLLNDLQILRELSNQETKPDVTIEKNYSDTTKALNSVKESGGSVRQLMFQLHPDKHPKELSWLFTEMFKIVY